MPLLPNTFTCRVLGKAAFGAAMLACALAGAWRSAPPAGAPLAALPAAELPAHWQGQPVRPLALSAVEQRFAQRFPGRISRLTDGRHIVVLREVTQPTRMLHPAADCYRALGWRIEAEGLERTGPAPHAPNAPVQRCFIARQPGQALRVCEHIDDARGQRFADTSAWYWAAALGQSHGPWRAVTTTQPWG
ncbi:MAG: hypothetical protein Q4F13_11930 [Pseudomonadota bacterium]|nr:hypothetical protein [Pseudomonadota bacterium]